MQDVEIQLSVLKDLQRFLVQFREDIREKSDEYNRRVSQLRENDITLQVADYYEANYAVQNLQYLQNIMANITENNLPQISAQIAQLEQKTIWRDSHGNIVAKKIGDRIWDNFGNWIYELRENRIYDTSGNWRYELRGDRIYDSTGSWIGYEY